MMLKQKGPYHVLGPSADSSNSYIVHRLPFCQGLGRPGVITEEHASRMELLPSTLILHRRTDGFDTRIAEIRAPFAQSPLVQRLGEADAGHYGRAQGDDELEWAFEKVADLWAEETASDSSEDKADDANAVDANNDESNGGEAPQAGEERTEVAQATYVRHGTDARSEAAGEAEGRGEKRIAEAARAETQHPSRKRKARRQRDERGNDNPYERHYPPPNQRSHRHRAAQRVSARQQLRKDDGRSLRALYIKVSH